MFNLTLERAEAHEVIGNLHRERGQFSLARDHYTQAEDLYRDAHMQLDSRELPDEQVRLLLAEGNISRARDAARKLMEKRERLGYAVPLARSRLLVGRALLESHDRDTNEGERGESALAARGLLIEALSQFTACRSHAMMARARILLARAELFLGSEEDAAAHLQEAIRLARQFNYAYWLKTEASRRPELFRLAFARNIEVDYLTKIGIEDWKPSIADTKIRGKAIAAAVGAAAPIPQPLRPGPQLLAEDREFDLVINLLGPVEVLREQGRRLAPDAWTLSRALKVLCFIASRQNHRATKDAIIETFWGETPIGDIDKNFWPTISYIRRALNSNQDVKKNFIRYRESAYYLNPEFNYLIDTEEFERLIALGHARRREGDSAGFAESAHRAIELYRGDFLEEFYDNWAEEQRAYYRNLYFATLKELADHYHRAEQYEQAINYCQIIIKRDPYREDIHRQLMDAYAHTGNRAALRDQYENLKKLLMEELGVDPLPETVATYKRLTEHELQI